MCCLGSEVLWEAVFGSEGSRRLPRECPSQGHVRFRAGLAEQREEESAMDSCKYFIWLLCTSRFLVKNNLAAVPCNVKFFWFQFSVFSVFPIFIYPVFRIPHLPTKIWAKKPCKYNIFAGECTFLAHLTPLPHPPPPTPNPVPGSAWIQCGFTVMDSTLEKSSPT